MAKAKNTCPAHYIPRKLHEEGIYYFGLVPEQIGVILGIYGILHASEAVSAFVNFIIAGSLWGALVVINSSKRGIFRASIKRLLVEFKYSKKMSRRDAWYV